MKKHADMSLSREETERVKNESVKLKFLYQMTQPNDQIPHQLGVDALRLIDKKKRREVN
jgi:hypothetical protein